MLDVKKLLTKVNQTLFHPLTFVTLTKTVSISAGTTSEISWSDVAPNGYKMVGLNSFTLAGNYPEYLAVNRWLVQNSTNLFKLYLRALTTSSTVTVTVTCYVLCLKDPLYDTGGIA